ncbi:MAG: M24 family metallopeptidase [Alphaproteobacteria bacterium]
MSENIKVDFDKLKKVTIDPDDDKARYVNSVAADKALVNPVKEETVRRARLYRWQRTVDELKKNNCAAALLYDPLNIRYATDTSNMQLWTTHNPSRYAMIFATGEVVLFDYHNCEHLHDHCLKPDGSHMVTEFMPALPWFAFASGNRVEEHAIKWADQIEKVMNKYAPGEKVMAVDTLDPIGVDLLRNKGYIFKDGRLILEDAREIKSADEIEMMKWTITVAQAGMERMYRNCMPGITENELWAHLHFENIRNGGEWIETRILSSGERTNPWMKECGDSVMQAGDIMSYDTDLIGPYGYCADVSRAYIVGHEKPTAEQQELYDIAHEHVNYNMERLKPGLTYKEWVFDGYKIRDDVMPQRYSCVGHGVGLCDEAPCLYHTVDWDNYGYDGTFKPGMVICVESYTGKVGGREGVKLEQQCLITETGYELLSDFPMDGFSHY